MLKKVLLIVLCASVSQVLAQDKWPIIKPLEWNDKNHLKAQREWIDDLARQRLGQRLRTDRTDLDTIQRIIDRSIIAEDDLVRLQALGVALGDLFADEYGLEWRIYLDQKGRSRATCVPKTEQCLFPITMLSRRVAVGLKPNVTDIYNEAAALIKPYLPKSPYQVD